MPTGAIEFDRFHDPDWVDERCYPCDFPGCGIRVPEGFRQRMLNIAGSLYCPACAGKARQIHAAASHQIGRVE